MKNYDVWVGLFLALAIILWVGFIAGPSDLEYLLLK